jgi:hypothetical protein
MYHQGTYTPQVSDRLRAGTEKGAGFLPFTGVRKSGVNPEFH